LVKLREEGKQTFYTLNQENIVMWAIDDQICTGNRNDGKTDQRHESIRMESRCVASNIYDLIYSYTSI
jgi:hypothetical protein